MESHGLAPPGGAASLTEARREVLADAEALAQRAAQFLVGQFGAATGEVRVALAGGSTPKRLYEILATPALQAQVPWHRVHWFWGDERFVPPDHPDSNYRMTRTAMLAAVPAAADHVHAVRTTGTTPEEAAVEYERLLHLAYGGTVLDPARPLFDVVLLGMGEDGHTASLFPGVPALAERKHWVAAVIGAKPEPRITLTFPALASARHVVFLVAGAAKYPILQRLRRGEDLPAGRVRPTGTIHWLLDRAAAEGRQPA